MTIERDPRRTPGKFVENSKLIYSFCTQVWTSQNARKSHATISSLSKLSSHWRLDEVTYQLCGEPVIPLLCKFPLLPPPEE